MISNAFIGLGYFVVSGILYILPNSTGFPAEAHTAAAGLGGYVGIWNPLVPMTTLGTILTFIFTVEIAIFSFKTTKWIISHIPFIGGKGK